MKETEKFSNFKKTHGPPYYSFDKEWDPLDKNEYLLSKGVDIEALKARNKGHTLITA